MFLSYLLHLNSTTLFPSSFFSYSWLFYNIFVSPLIIFSPTCFILSPQVINMVMSSTSMRETAPFSGDTKRWSPHFKIDFTQPNVWMYLRLSSWHFCCFMYISIKWMAMAGWHEAGVTSTNHTCKQCSLRHIQKTGVYFHFIQANGTITQHITK